MREKYTEMNKTKWIFLLLSVLFVITFIVGYQVGEMRSEDFKTSDTVVKVEFDTIETIKDTTITKFIPKIIEKLKVDTVKKDTVLVTERKEYINECTNENDTAIIMATIVGVNASLDSLSVLWKKHSIIQTNTVTVTKYIEKPKKLITIQPQIGVGYGIFNRNVDMYVGIGIGANI